MHENSLIDNPTPQSIAELDELVTRPSPSLIEAISKTEGDFAVLGAGGKMGHHVTGMLIRTLRQLGRPNTVHAVSRFQSAESETPFRQMGANVIRADLSDPKQTSQLPSVANAIYLAGIKFGTSSQPELLQKMNVDMPRVVAKQFCDARIVALSTGCVYSFTSPESGGSTETSDRNPPGEYARSCLAREQAFMDGSSKFATRCALVRLNYAVDCRYGVLVDLAHQLLRGDPIDVTTGYVNLIWQGDAIDQILRCLPETTSPPWIVNVTGSEVWSVRDLAHRLARELNQQSVARSRETDKPHPQTEGMNLDHITPLFVGKEADTCWLSNNGLARSRFGDPSVSVEQIIRWVAHWVGQGRPTLGKPTHFQVRDGDY